MKKVLILTAILEAATSLALLIVPSFVSRLLLGEETKWGCYTRRSRDRYRSGRIRLSCWPGPPQIGMATYSAAVALYLAYVGVLGGFTGGRPPRDPTVLLGSVWLTTDRRRL
jgi:hypothetical protein